MTRTTEQERFEAWYEENIGDENKPVREAAFSAWHAACQAQVTPSSADAIVNVWQQAVDNELVSAHLGVAGDVTVEDAVKTLHDLICWNIEVATDPLTNGGKVLVPADVLTANKPPEAALVQMPEPVAYLHECGKKPSLRTLEFSKAAIQLSAKGYKSLPLYTEQQVIDLLKSVGVIVKP